MLKYRMILVGHDGGDPHTPGPAGHDGGDPHTPGPAGHDGGDPHTPGRRVSAEITHTIVISDLRTISSCDMPEDVRARLVEHLDPARP